MRLVPSVSLYTQGTFGLPLFPNPCSPLPQPLHESNRSNPQTENCLAWLNTVP